MAKNTRRAMLMFHSYNADLETLNVNRQGKTRAKKNDAGEERRMYSS